MNQEQIAKAVDAYIKKGGKIKSLGHDPNEIEANALGKFSSFDENCYLSGNYDGLMNYVHNEVKVDLFADGVAPVKHK